MAHLGLDFYSENLESLLAASDPRGSLRCEDRDFRVEVERSVGLGAPPMFSIPRSRISQFQVVGRDSKN